MVYEEYMRAIQSSFISSPSPAKCAHVRIPDRKLIRWSSDKKAEVDADNFARHQHQEHLKAEKRMARLAKLSSAPQTSEALEASSPAPIDPAELRQIINAFEQFFENDHERDELIVLTTRHLQQLPGASELFKQFTRMLRSRRK